MSYLGNFASLQDVSIFYPNGGSEGDSVQVSGTYYAWNGSSWEESTPSPVILASVGAQDTTGQINYLGAYADKASVWADYPEGGHAGDYVTINSVITLWNPSTLDWGASSSAFSPTIASQTVNGSLTVNYNLTVAGSIIIAPGKLNITGGTSTKFVKGDGSLDDNVYATAAQLATAVSGYADSMAVVANTGIVLKHGNTELSTVTKAQLESLLSIGTAASYLRGLSDVYHNTTTILRSDGTAANNNDVLTYDSTNARWVAAASQGGGGGGGESTMFELDTTSVPGTTLIKAKYGLYSNQDITAGGVGSGGGGGGGTSVSWESYVSGTNYQGLNVGGTSKNLLLYDSTGTTGQVLTKTATGVAWQNGGGGEGGSYLPLSGGSMSGNITMNSNFLYLDNTTSGFSGAFLARKTSAYGTGAHLYGGTEGVFIGNAQSVIKVDSTSGNIILVPSSGSGTVAIQGNLTVTGTYPGGGGTSGVTSVCGLSGIVTKAQLQTALELGAAAYKELSYFDMYLAKAGGTMIGTLNTQQINPASNGAYSIGASSAMYDSVFAGKWYADGSHYMDYSNGFRIHGDAIIPDTDAAKTIGSSSLAWSAMYVNRWYPKRNDTSVYIEYDSTNSRFKIVGNVYASGNVIALGDVAASGLA